ncbi:D-alanyl-D-alanine carboxypeptidase [bacterium BMS3Bbin01]|nr:D-alanyl-D-alanine carboxypeptidase [bacterium BMS3Bbin01]
MPTAGFPVLRGACKDIGRMFDRHTIRNALFLALVMTILTAMAPAAYAVVGDLISEDEAYTGDLVEQGLENGRLPDEALLEVDGSQRRCSLEADAARWWVRLVDTAAADGVQIEAAWCYRSIASQRQTYIRNCGGIGAPQSACNKATATPGRSNHGWARAIDVTSGGLQIDCRSVAFRWLSDHGAEYGWVHPWWAMCGGDTPEPWHWEWGGIVSGPRPAVGAGIRPD